MIAPIVCRRRDWQERFVHRSQYEPFAFTCVPPPYGSLGWALQQREDRLGLYGSCDAMDAAEDAAEERSVWLTQGPGQTAAMPWPHSGR